MFHSNLWPWRVAASKSAGRTRRCFRPEVESLEGRLAPATFVVTTRADVVDPVDGERSLREAITQANTGAGADMIVLPAGVFRIGRAGVNENGNASGDFDVTGSVTIRGAGANKTVIDGQQLDRVFDVAGVAPGSITVVFQGLTVQSGSVSGNGGGIGAVNANLVIRDCIIAGNQASLSGGGVHADAAGSVAILRSAVRGNVAGDDGAGVHCTAGVLTVKSSTVRRNVAEENGGGILAGNTATIIKSTVSDNIANSFGGGIHAAALTLTNSTVSGNAALFGGGGVYAFDATLINTTVSGNRIGFSGGGIRVIRTATLLNCTVVDNVAQQGGGLFHDAGGGTFTVKNTIVALNVVRFGAAAPTCSEASSAKGTTSSATAPAATASPLAFIATRSVHHRASSIPRSARSRTTAGRPRPMPCFGAAARSTEAPTPAPHAATSAAPNGHTTATATAAESPTSAPSSANEPGDTKVRVWLDTIRTIKDIDDARLTVVFKDGQERDYRHSGADRGGDLLVVYYDNDSRKKIPVMKLKEVGFLRPPRMDGEKQAMFDHWRYSPFTGERLPPVDAGVSQKR